MKSELPAGEAVRENVLRSVFEHSDVAYVRLGTDACLRDANRAWLTLHGFEHLREAFGKPFTHFVSPEARPRAQAFIAEALLGEHVHSAELFATLADGSFVFYTASAQPLLDEDGGIIGAETLVIDITRQKLAEDRLEEAQRKYQNFFDSAVDGMFRSTPDGRLLAANAACANLLGYDSPAQVIAALSSSMQPLWVTPEERARTVCLLEERGRVQGLETRFRRRDGTAIWVSLSARRVFEPGQQAPFYEGSLREVTARKLAEQEAETGRQILRLAARAARFGVFRWDARTSAIIWSPELFEMYGLDPSASAPSPDDFVNQFVHPDDRARVRVAFENTVHDPQGNYYNEFRNLDGSRWIAGIGQLHRDQHGNAECVVGIDIDITDRKESEEELRLSEEILDNLSEGFSIVDEDGVILRVNRQMEAMFGYGSGELTLRHVSILNAPGEKTPREVAAAISAELKVEGRWSGEVRNVKKDGAEFWTRCSSANLWSRKHGLLSISVHRDITQMKRMSEDRARLEEELHEAQRLESVGRLAGGIAHDFNNLLTVINGYADILTSELDRSSRLWPYAQDISNAGDRAAALTQQLLAFSRKQTLRSVPLNLSSLVLESEPMLRRLVGDPIELCSSLDPGLALVLADPHGMHQVLLNLVLNARDAIAGQGRIAITTANVIVEAPLHPGFAPGSYATLSIEDSGVGMDEATVKRIFEPFFTTKQFGKGTGLGLASVYGTIKQSNGWIDVDSHPGKGTTFCIYLPQTSCTLPDEQPAAAASRKVSADSAARATVLVVEDEPAVCKLEKAVLESRGYRVLDAADPDTAEKIADEFPGEIHLLLTDVMLPGRNGKELSESLKRGRPQLRVIFLSGYTAEVFGPAGPLKKPDAFLQKPFSADLLAAKVEEVLAARPDRG